MDQFYSVLSSWWKGDPYDELTLNIISALPMEIAIIILRLLDPRSLCEAILVNRSWLSLIRSDAVLRARVHAELVKQRRAYWALIDGPIGAGRMPNAILDAVYYRHLQQMTKTMKERPQASRRRTSPSSEVEVIVSEPAMQGVHRAPVTRRPPIAVVSPFPQPLASSTPATHPRQRHGQHTLKAAKHRPSTKLRDRPINRKPSCLRL